MPPFDPREASTSRSRDRRASEAVPKDGRGEGEDSLLERNIIYNRLMSGQVTETGEVPPSYGEAVASAVRARSASRPGRGGQDGREGREGREESGSRSRSRLRQSILA